MPIDTGIAKCRGSETSADIQGHKFDSIRLRYEDGSTTRAF